jgi:hypothetical protein
VGKSEVTMSGKAAAFGGRMMTSIADQILKQFADNFATQVAARAAQHAAEPAPPAGTDGTLAPAPPPARSAPRELNGLVLMWAVFKDWLRGLFSKKAA